MVWLLWAKSTKTKLEKIQSFSYFHWYYNWNQTVTYESSREVKMTLRDSNENVKKKNNRFRLTKQQLKTCTKLFCTFLCRQARLWRELPNFTFHRQCEHATTNFSFHPQLSLTQIGPTCAEGYHLVDVWQASLLLLAVSGSQDLIPVLSPHSPTRSLKQDNEAHGGG